MNVTTQETLIKNIYVYWPIPLTVVINIDFRLCVFIFDVKLFIDSVNNSSLYISFLTYDNAFIYNSNSTNGNNKNNNVSGNEVLLVNKHFDLFLLEKL